MFMTTESSMYGINLTRSFKVHELNLLDTSSVQPSVFFSEISEQ